jgi:peptidoglycan-N-acetylglucosamine deacetylase
MVVSKLFPFLFAMVAVANPLGAQTATPTPPVANEKPAASAAPAEPSITFSWIHTDGPYIAMTFDDGPSGVLTPKLLDLLAARHIKATFFLIGQNVVDHPEIVARALKEGHELGNHSWSHPNLAKMSDEGVRSQLRRTDDAIKSAAGISPKVMRPPYGSITPREKRWINNEFGYKIILWDVDPLDWKRPGPSVVCNRILKETRAGSIILSHDIHPGTIEAMPATFSQLEAKGFKFVTVSELIGMATPEPPKPKPSPAQRAHPPAKSASPVATPSPGG